MVARNGNTIAVRLEPREWIALASLLLAFVSIILIPAGLAYREHDRILVALQTDIAQLKRAAGVGSMGVPATAVERTQ